MCVCVCVYIYIYIYLYIYVYIYIYFFLMEEGATKVKCLEPMKVITQSQRF